jgi:hypothetical protein
MPVHFQPNRTPSVGLIQASSFRVLVVAENSNRVERCKILRGFWVWQMRFSTDALDSHGQTIRCCDLVESRHRVSCCVLSWEHVGSLASPFGRRPVSHAEGRQWVLPLPSPRLGVSEPPGHTCPPNRPSLSPDRKEGPQSSRPHVSSPHPQNPHSPLTSIP